MLVAKLRSTMLVLLLSGLIAACTGHGFSPITLNTGDTGTGDTGTGDTGGTPVSQTDNFIQAPAGKTDILFVIDNSGSMKEEQAALAQSFQDLIADLNQIGGDYQIAVTSTTVDDFSQYTAYRIGNCDDTGNLPEGASLLEPYALLAFGNNPTILSSQTMTQEQLELYFTQNVAVGTCGSGWESGIMSGIETLQSPNNASFLRSDAQLDLVFVSDEDDCTDPYTVRAETGSNSQGACHDPDVISNVLTDVGDLVSQLSSIKSNFRTHSIIWIPGDTQGAALFEGTRYRDATTGFLGSINDNFSALAAELGATLAQPISDFTLSQTPVPETISIVVNGSALLSSDGVTIHWEYQAPRTIHFFDAATDVPPDSTMTITYDVAN